MSKYFDLENRIYEDTALSGHITIGEVLQWLDEHPDQAPGRTITESDFCEAVDKAHEWTDEGFARTVLNRLGITVTPDPESTNAESISKLLAEFTELNACCCGEQGDHDLAEFLDARGVKAGSDD